MVLFICETNAFLRSERRTDVSLDSNQAPASERSQLPEVRDSLRAFIMYIYIEREREREKEREKERERERVRYRHIDNYVGILFVFWGEVDR